MPSNLQLSEVTSPTDFPTITSIIWSAFEQPVVNPFLRIMFYLKSNSPTDRALAKEITSQTLLSIHESDPSSHWIKITDPSTEEVVACTNWNFHEKNPYEDGHGDMEATWWPEGEGRVFASRFYKQCVEHKERIFDRGHVYVNIFATLPTHQRQGAGGKMLEWGLKWADERGLEAFTESSEVAKPLYEKFGFEVVKVVKVDEESMRIDNEEPSLEWKELVRTLCPLTLYIMKRSPGGKENRMF